jgi:protein-S-isoprenylcysteine O-methyltransferase Ste14
MVPKGRFAVDTHGLRAASGEGSALFRTQAAAILLIILQLSATLGVGYAISLLLAFVFGFQPSVALPVLARLLGLALIAFGTAIGLYTLRYRRPRDMLASTSVTLLKFVQRKPTGDAAGRTEPFIPAGPYQFVRNPLYFGVIVLALGFAIALSSFTLILWDAVLVFWFWTFLIPFEERELAALFGKHYEQYRRQVPKLFPTGKKYRSPG